MDRPHPHAAQHLPAHDAVPLAPRRSHAGATNSLKEPIGSVPAATAAAQNFASTFQHSRETQMHRLLTSIVLCVVAHTAAAQCVDTTPLAARVHSGAGLVRTSATSGAAPLPKPAGGDLIKTAAAGPRDVAMRQSPSISGPPKAGTVGEDEDEPRRTGPAMLIAALAVMTAIALRRSGGSGQ